MLYNAVYFPITSNFFSFNSFFPLYIPSMLYNAVYFPITSNFFSLNSFFPLYIPSMLYNARGQTFLPRFARPSPSGRGRSICFFFKQTNMEGNITCCHSKDHAKGEKEEPEDSAYLRKAVCSFRAHTARLRCGGPTRAARARRTQFWLGVPDTRQTQRKKKKPTNQRRVQVPCDLQQPITNNLRLDFQREGRQTSAREVFGVSQLFQWQAGRTTKLGS